MNSREKFLETMRFNPKVSVNKWEFGIWGATIERWYKEGLPQKKYPRIPTNIINTTASLYTAIWTNEWRKQKTVFEKIYRESEGIIKLPKGIAVMTGGLYWPTQGFPLDNDVSDYFGLTKAKYWCVLNSLYIQILR